MPRSQDFWSEYEKYSTVLSILRSAMLPLNSHLGLADFEVISPCNPDTLYMRILVQICVLLLNDVLAQDGDISAYRESLNAAKDIAKLVRLMRSAGRPQGPDQEVPGTHEIQAPYNLVVGQLHYLL